MTQRFKRTPSGLLIEWLLILAACIGLLTLSWWFAR